MKDYHQSDKVELIWCTYEFNYDMVRGLIPRYSKEEIQDLILEFDGYVDIHRCAGYIDVSMMITDALSIVMERSFGYTNQQVSRIDYWKDYYSELWDVIASNEEEMDDSWAGLITDVAERAHLLLNIFVLGLTLHLPDDEREFLACNIGYFEDIHLYTKYDPWVNPYLQLVGDLIILPCLVGEQCDDEDKKEVHSFYLNACNRRLSDNARRTQRDTGESVIYNIIHSTGDPSRYTARDYRRSHR